MGVGRPDRNKQKIVEDENPKITSNDNETAQTDASTQQQNIHNSQLAATAKKPDHQMKQQLQPSSEQLMIAHLIEGNDEKADDPNQRQKIQQVMDITGKAEEIVATALFDAGWDENLAIGMLLEGGDQLTAWEETGKGGKKKKKEKAADDKDDWDDADTWGNDSREKSRQRGPPRMRRGGNNSQGDRDRGATKGGRDMTNGNLQGSNATDDWDNNQFEGRGGGKGDRGGMPRRGRGGGGTGGGPGRDQAQSGLGNGGLAQDSAVVGFSGSIDTWNPGPSNDGSTGGGGSRDGQRRSRGQNSKDAFDNAGNWGDDFPAADDWDNEEYTGSLADTKVFTASSGSRKPTSKQPQQKRKDDYPQSKPQTAQHQQPLKQPQVIGTNRNSYNADSSLNGPSHEMAPSQAQPPSVPQLQSSLVSQQTVPPSSVAVGAPTSSYSQSIDLSTLLHKPTTQSSIGPGSQQQSLLQFTQQATDSLKAAVGIGQPGQSSQPKASDLGSYGSYGPPSAAGTAVPNSGYGQTSAFGSIKQTSNVNSTSNQNLNQQPQSGSSYNSDGVSSFEFNGNLPGNAVQGPSQSQSTQQNTNKEDKYLSSDKAKNVSVNVSAVSSSSGVPSGANNIDAYGHPHAPSAKEVSKSLSNAMSGGKLVGQGNDSFDPRKQVASGAGPGGYPSRGPPPPPGGMDMKAANDVLSGYAQQNNYNNYSKQSSYGNQYSQNQYGGPTNPNQSSTYGSSSASSSSGYASQNNYSSSSTPNTQQAQTNYKSTAASASYPTSSGQPNDSLNKAAVGGFGADSNLAASASGNAAAVLGLTSTTNALSGKVSATTASKVNVPNLPPGVASMLPPQYMASLPAAAFYGLQQPAAAMYSAYGNAGLEDLAALQRQAGLHTLVGSTATGANALAQAQELASGNPTVHQPTAGGTVKGQTTGYYDPSNQYAATSLAAAAGRNQSQDGGSSLNSLSTSVSTATTMTGSSSTNTGSSGSSSNLNSGSDK